MNGYHLAVSLKILSWKTLKYMKGPGVAALGWGLANSSHCSLEEDEDLVAAGERLVARYF